MKTLGDMTVAERDEEYRQLLNRLGKTESILYGGPDNPSPGLAHMITQLTQAVAQQGLQISEQARMLQDGLGKKMDVVIDEMNQPVSISILAHDVGDIRKMLQRALLWLAGIGVAALLLLGRTAYNVFPALQEAGKH